MKKYALPTILIIILISGLVFIIDSNITKSENSQNLNFVQPNWKEINAESIQALKDSNGFFFTKYQHYILDFKNENINDLPSYISFGLNCISYTKKSQTGDFFLILNTIRNQSIRSKEKNNYLDSLKTDIAQNFIELGLYRSSWEVLANFPSPNTSRAIDLKHQLESLLSYTEEYSSNDIRCWNCNLDISKSIEGRLWDFLTIQPENGWYNQFIVNPQYNGYYNQNYKEGFLLKLFDKWNYTYKKQNSSLKREKIFEDDEFVEEIEDSTALSNDTTESISLENFDEYNLGFKQEEPSTSLINLLNRDFDLLKKSEKTDILKYKYLLELGCNNGLYDSDIIINELYSYVVYKNTLIFTFWDGGEQFCIVAVTKNSKNQIKVLRNYVYSIEKLDLLDVNNDGNKELILNIRQGSGGFLDVFIFEMDTLKTIWDIQGIYHGSFTIMNLDKDRDLEIIITSATEERIVECNQCPSRYISMLYDFSNSSKTFNKIVETKSSSELLLNTHANLTGMSPSMIRSVLIDKELPSLIRKYLINPKLVNITNINDLMGGFKSSHDIFDDLKDYKEGSLLCKDILTILKQSSLPIEEKNLHILATKEILLQDYFLLNDLTKFKIEINDSVFEKVPSDFKQSSAIFKSNIEGLMNLQNGNFGDAYMSLQNANIIANYKSSYVLGNLAYYYSVIGDSLSTYKNGLAALDKSYISDDSGNPYIDMIHIARSLNSNDIIEQLDWLLRAVRAAKGSINGNNISAILGTAAEIAIKNNFPKIGLVILDEAIGFTNQYDWEHEGENLLFMYGKGLLKLGKIEEAKIIFEVIKSNSLINSNSFINACFELSKIYYSENYLEQSIDLANICFEASFKNRKSIFVESQKFFYLYDKKDIVTWYLKLLCENNASNDLIFKTIENWKMQTYLDLTENKSVEEFNLLNFRKSLGKEELFLDYIDLAGKLLVFYCNRDEAGYTIIQNFNKKDIIDLKEEFNIYNQENFENIVNDNFTYDLKTKITKVSNSLLPSILPIGTSKIIISPDDILYGLPWSCLINKEKFLIENNEILVTPSAKFNFNSKSIKIIDSKNALIIGALNQIRKNSYAKLQSLQLATDLPKLKGGAREFESTYKILNEKKFNTTCFIDEGSSYELSVPNLSFITSQNLVGNFSNKKIIHIICHGLFNRFDPMQSCLLLSNGEIIMAKDIEKLNISNNSLVCLSSCESGMNTLKMGAEPFGFLRAFLKAGSKNIISSLTTQFDKSNRFFFNDFYKNYSLDFDASKSYKNAVKKLIQEYKHPYYWASNSLFGQ